MLISLTSIDHPTHKIVAQSNNLSKFSFLVRRSIKEMLTLTCVEISKGTQTPEFQIIQHKFDKTTYTFFIKIYNDIVNIACVDCEYPPHVAIRLLSKMQAVPLDSLIKEYSDYKKVDYMCAVNDELDETKQVLTRTLEDVLGRGEKLDNLVRNAEDLSAQTKTLFEMSKSKNRCFC